MDELEIVEKLTKLEQHDILVDQQIEDLKKVTEEIHTMSGAIIKLTEQMKSTSTDVKEIKKDVNNLKDRPASKWETIQKTIITAFTSGIVAILVSVIANAT